MNLNKDLNSNNMLKIQILSIHYLSETAFFQNLIFSETPKENIIILSFYNQKVIKSAAKFL